MISYRFKRRAFLAGIGGGVGLKVMLRNYIEHHPCCEERHKERLA